jgi:predicted branched-subunit amino acid permease
MRTFLKGLTAAIPIASGYIPVAITFGLIVRSFGLSPLDAALASILVFAGAAQFLAIGMYGSGIAAAGVAGGVVAAGAAGSAGAAGAAAGTAGATGAAAGSLTLGVVAGTPVLLLVQIVIAGWLLNLRHLLMSSVIAHNISGSAGLGLRSLLAFGVTDEVFGVAGWRIAEGGAVRPPFLLGLEVGAYSAWVGGTIIGALAGEILPFHLRIAMGLALYALFAALLAGQIRAAHRRDDARVAPLVVAAAVAATINGTLRLAFGWDAGAAFPLAMIAGALVAMTVPAGTEEAGTEEPGTVEAERAGGPAPPAVTAQEPGTAQAERVDGPAPPAETAQEPGTAQAGRAGASAPGGDA